MMSWATLSVFIPTFLFVSLTPGMCMTLAMVLGMTQGVKRTLWMMVGELIGVGFVAAAAGAGRVARRTRAVPPTDLSDKVRQRLSPHPGPCRRRAKAPPHRDPEQQHQLRTPYSSP